MAMMNYRRDNKRSIAERMVVPLLVTLFLLVLYVFGPGLFNLSLRALLSVVAPVSRVTQELSDSREGFLMLISRKVSLVEENRVLRRQAAELTLVRAENERLRSELSLFTRAELPPSPLIATVIVKPPHSIYDTLIIDISRIPEVRQGMLVLSLDGAALGTVGGVFGGVAKVLLFSSSGVRVPSSLGASTTPVDLVGRGGGTFRATIPSRIKVAAGDWISSSQFGGRIVAIVEAVSPDSSQLSTTIDARIPISFNALSSVVLIHAPALYP